MSRRIRAPALCCLVAVAAAQPGDAVAGVAASATAAGRCAEAARAFLDGLDPAQRSKAVAAFDDGPRRKFSYRPGAALRTEGLRIGDLRDEQRVLAHGLVSCGLSAQGYQKVLGIIERDDIVRENFASIRFATEGMPVEVGAGWYWIAIFGEPSVDRPWGWQVEGHHLALNFAAVDGGLAVTPAFMGADPATILAGPRSGFRVLHAEFDRGLELLESLAPAQRSRAVLSATLPRGLFSTPERRESLQKFEGIPAADLDEGQRRLLWRLIEEYLRNAEPAAAERLLARIAADDIGRVHFAWMGAAERGRPAYYRVHGPSIIIEFDHAPDIRSRDMAPDMNHVHTWWRMPGLDFGEDLLERHYRESPDHRPGDGDVP